MASSSESSEEEDLEKFAVITNIVNSEVAKFNDSSHSRAKAKPSLRHWREEEDTAFSSSELITPELRQHVAKKLSKFLDKNYICTQEVGHLQKRHANRSHDSSGIRLLLSSNHRLQEESTSTISKKNAINISNSSESDTDDEELNRLTEAAVSGYSIIQTVESTSHNGSREQVEDEAVQTNGVKREKEKKRKKEKRKKTKVDEDKKEKKHKKHKKEKYEDKT